MSNPVVSVCIVTFNHEHYIHECIMSVIAQCNDVKLEILIGDDQSDDKTAKIIKSLEKKYPAYIRYFRHSKRLGYGSENLQTLLKKTRGSYIAHLDGDDFWMPGKLAEQVRFLENTPDCSAVYTNALAINNDGHPVGLFNNTQPTSLDLNYLLTRGNFLNHSSICYRSVLRKNILKMKVPFLDYRIHLSHAQHGSIGYINQALVGYRVNSSSSVIIHANERIRRLYWEALTDLLDHPTHTYSLARGMSEFARSVFFRSLRIRKISLLQQWLPIVLQAAPTGKIKMLLLIIAAIFRVTAQEGFSMICRKLTGNKTRILYRR